MSAPAQSRRPGYRELADLERRIWLMAGVRAVNTMGLSLVMAFMTIYLVADRGESGATVGLVYLVANLAQSVAQGYAGEISDRVGRRPLMIASLAIRAGVMAAIGALVVAEASLWTLAPVLVLSSVLRGGFEPVAYAMVADMAAPERRVAAFSVQRMGTNLGWSVGPALGGLLAAVTSYGTVFFISTVPLALCAVAVAAIQEPARTVEHTDGAPRVSLREAFSEAFRRADMTLLLIGTLLLALTHVQLFFTLSVFADEELGFSKADVGLLYTVNGAAVLLLQLPAVAMIARLGTRTSLIVAPLLYAAGFLLVGTSAGFLLAALAVLIITTGEVLLAPAHQAIAAELGDPRRMGRAFGLIGTTMTLGVAVAPVLGGVVFDALHHRHVAMWSVLAALPVLLALTFVAFRFTKR